MSPTFAAEILQKYPEMGEAKCYIIRGLLGFHFLFVGAFFSLSFYLVYFRFSAFTPQIPTRQKVMRNKIYTLCGAAMFAAFITIGILASMNKASSIFWPEAVAVIAFAAAWLVKGQTILKDRPA
jgi:sterol desaturase/sphingolipid hydroxylase (fatty acid hydroxylase superfamily)